MASDSRSLHTKASEETLISLLQLDPAPIDNASVYDKELPPLPEEALESSNPSIRSSPRATTSSLGLSGSGYGPIYYCMFCFGPMRCHLLLTTVVSIANPALLILHICLLRRPSPDQYFRLPPHIPIRSLLRTLFAHGPRALPDTPNRTLTRRSPRGSPRHLGRRYTSHPSTTEPEAIWRRDSGNVGIAP